MASKQVVQRQTVAGALCAAVTAWGEEVTPALDQRVTPFLEDGETGLDFSLLQEVLERMVAASLEEMIEADKAHVDERAGDGAYRTWRDAAVAALRRKLIEIRAIATGLYGPQRSREILAVQGRIASQPDLLWRQGEHTLARLKRPELELPAATTAAIRFDPRRLANELKPLVEDLRRAIKTIELERRSAEVTLAVKQEAMAEHDRLMSACGRILSGLHLLAGRPDLARRIRVTVPRRKSGATRTSVEAPAEVTPDRDAVAGAAAAEVVRRDQDGEPPRPADSEPRPRAAVTADRGDRAASSSRRIPRVGPHLGFVESQHDLLPRDPFLLEIEGHSMLRPIALNPDLVADDVEVQEAPVDPSRSDHPAD